MQPVIGVKTENRHLAELVSLKGRTSGLLKLTTLRPDQRKAAIRVFYVGNGKKELLTEFILKNLNQGRAGSPSIDMEGAYNGGFRLDLTLKLNGRVLETRRVRLTRFLPGQLLVRVMMPVIALLVAAFLLFMLLPPGWEKARVPVPVRSSPISRESVAPDQGPQTSETPLVVAPPPVDSPPPAVPLPKEDLQASGALPPEEPPPPASFAPAAVYFLPDEAVLTPEARQRLTLVLEMLREYEGAVVISGHCASFGTEAGREELSLARARAVHAFLLEQGWDPPPNLRILGLGSTHPVEENSDMQHLNRRVEIKPNEAKGPEAD